MNEVDLSKLKISVACLFANDSILLIKNASERSITCKLARYLQDQYPDYDVDCEYNLNINNENKRKVIHCIETEYKKYKEERKGKTVRDIAGIEYLEVGVYPDIIIHKRDSNAHNNIIFEIKKSSNHDESPYDRFKLKKYTEENCEFKYSLGLFLTIFVGEDFQKMIEVEEYVNGMKQGRNLTISST